MKKIIINFIYITIFILELSLIKIYNEKIINNKEIIIQQNTIDYILNKSINPNIKKEELIEYEMILEIPKINLKKGILNKDDIDNNIEKNISILNESSYPNQEGNIYLAAHSGNGNKSFFNDLVKLSIKDSAYLYYEDIKYIYEVIEIREVNKYSSLTIQTKSKNNLILITCSQKDKSKYLIIILNNINKTEF